MQTKTTRQIERYIRGYVKRYKRLGKPYRVRDIANLLNTTPQRVRYWTDKIEREYSNGQ